MARTYEGLVLDYVVSMFLRYLTRGIEESSKEGASVDDGKLVFTALNRTVGLELQSR